MSKTISCVDHYGNWHEIPVEKLQIRISVYGILRENNSIVLAQEKWKKRWEFPGGGIELGENLESALTREFLEETGLDIAVGAFHSFVESWFYAEDRGISWHGFLFYYYVSRRGGTLYKTVTEQDVVNVSILNPKDLSEENTELNTFNIVKKL